MNELSANADRRTEQPTILVVEDEVLIRMMTCNYLRGSGFNVVEAADAESALAYLESGQPVAMVFSDVGLRGSVDGFALACEIISSYPRCKVILTSGHEPDPREEGIAPFLPKPYRLSHVERLIEKTIMVDI